MLKNTLLLVATLALAFGQTARAAEPQAKDAIAMVDKTSEMLKKTSFDAVKAKIMAKDPELNQGELYAVLWGIDGNTLAHPNPAVVGKNMLDVPDVDGKMFRREIIELGKSKGKGWVDYKYKNPVSGKTEPKTIYILRQGDYIVGAGIYK